MGWLEAGKQKVSPPCLHNPDPACRHGLAEGWQAEALATVLAQPWTCVCTTLFAQPCTHLLAVGGCGQGPCSHNAVCTSLFTQTWPVFAIPWTHLRTWAGCRQAGYGQEPDRGQGWRREVLQKLGALPAMVRNVEGQQVR
eukprot:1159902-Pelagomonas_calceolata.AAC.11